MKKQLYIPFFLIFIMLLGGCGNTVKNEKQILLDLESNLQADYFAENEKIIEVKIDKRQTEKDTKQDTVWCTIQTEDEKCAYEKNLVLTYTLYSEGGWMLDDVSVNNRSEWSIIPITGASSEEISASLNGINVTADNDIWQVTPNKIRSISIDKQETDLEAETDVVTLSLIIEDLVEEASGQLVIHYIFDDKWVIDSISGNENFKAALKPGLAVNMTEENLADAITGQFFTYGTQKITVNEKEVSDFAIESQKASSKGTVQQYYCSCTLTKSHAVFALEIEISYRYSEEWKIQPISISADCISVEIGGNWSGTNVYGRICELNVIEMDADGNISGTYSDKGDSNREGYSYYVTGKIDQNTLVMSLEAGDMIGEKPYKWFEPNNITARLNVDDSSIDGRADLAFTIVQ